MLKIIHAADFHLDSPFSGLTPAGAVQRRREQRQLLERLAALVQARGADLVLLSGDLLDGDRVYRETVQALTAALGAMPCPVFLAPGNHDFYSGDSAYAAVDWPDNVHLFTGGEMEAVPLPELNCTVYGRAFTGPPRGGLPPVRLPGGGGRPAAGGAPRGGGHRRGLRPHDGGGDRRQRPALSGSGPYPPVQRPETGGGYLLGLPRLSRGPGL